MSFDTRLSKVMELVQSLRCNKDQMIALTGKDLSFTVKDTSHEFALSLERLRLFLQTRETLEPRRPLGGSSSWVAVMLSYYGSAWWNAAILAAYLVGNKVLVKFSSQGAQVMAFTETLYRPIFGDEIRFCQMSGQKFMERSLHSPEVDAFVIFGSDRQILPYQEAVRRTGKKLIFAGPGVAPFIVFPDADLELALDDLMTSKFAYSGQTCTAPQRIFIHESIYAPFLEMVADEMRSLFVGDPEDLSTDIAPLASPLAVPRIKRQLQDAVQRGAKILAGGEIDRNLVYPTLVQDATDDMLGMQEAVLGPVLFTSSFSSPAEVIDRARNHQYGLRAAIFGGNMAKEVATALKGEDYCHPVPDYTYGKFGMVTVNETGSQASQGALVTKAVGGYGHSGWVWETVNGHFQIKQGPKLIALETSVSG